MNVQEMLGRAEVIANRAAVEGPKWTAEMIVELVKSFIAPSPARGEQPDLRHLATIFRDIFTKPNLAGDEGRLLMAMSQLRELLK
jgi:hypothetical protein